MDRQEYKKTAEIGIQRDALPNAIAIANFVFGKIDFDKPFRAIVECDPAKPKMAIEVYEVN